MRRIALWATLVAATWMAPFGAARAQAEWPAKPITMIVPFPPGGVADTVARPVAEALGKALKQSVVVENKAGAGGSVGIAAASRAASDGYTVLMSLSSIVVLPEADRIRGREPAFTLERFVPIARFTADPTVLAVRADAPWQTLQDFIDDAKKRPGAINFGSSGNYGTMHVPMEMLKSATGIHLVHIPYTGAGPAVVALLGGQVEAVASGPATVVQHVKAGKLRVLAHWGDQPLAALPGVPSLKERGIAAQFAQWSGLFVPTGTPDAIVQKLRDAARVAVEDPVVVTTINRAGSPLAYQDQAAFQDYVAADAGVMKDVVRRIGKVD